MSAPPEIQAPQLKVPLLVRLLRFGVLSFLGLAMLALLLLIGLVGVQMALEDRVVPGVQVGEVDIGGLTRADAVSALSQQYGAVESTTFTFRDGDRAWTASAADLGLRFPADELVDSAFNIGHAEDGRRNLQDQARAWFQGEQLPVTLQFDESVAFAFLQRLSLEINRERQDATLAIDGYSISIDPGLSGRKLNVEASMEDLRVAILKGEGEGDISLVVAESPAWIGNVEEAAALAHTALSAPVQLVGTRPNGEILAPWIISLDQIRAGLQVTRQVTGDDLRFEVSVDLGAFARYLGTLSPSLSTVPADGRFDFDPSSGQLSAISPSTSGRKLKVDETIRLLELAVFEPVNRRVAMVFEALPPRYPAGVTAAELGITELVSEATTYFWGSWQNRRSNIALGAGKLHGVIVAPGEEFSFNAHLGEITPENGYLEGSVILGGATVTGIGGGICQVSTTMFRAAFSGGYAITERNNHGYRVGYYEYAGAGPGLDAAIWQPEVDLRFQNNTPYHVLIESDFLPTQDAIQFRFYSTRHWHTVIENPIVREYVPAPEAAYVEAADLALGQVRQIDYSADGADVLVYRNIYDTDGSLVKRDQVFTHYLPWQAVFEVAPGDPRLLEDEEDENDVKPVGVSG